MSHPVGFEPVAGQQARPFGRVIAVTGARGRALPSRLVERLERDRGVAKVLAIDVAGLPARAEEVGGCGLDRGLGKVRFCPLDLTSSGAERALVQLLRDEAVEAVVHGAFLAVPQRDTTWAHELESVGTMRVLSACAAASVGQLVAWSQTLVYGASPRHPNYLSEGHELAVAPGSSFLRDKIDAEQQIARFAQRHPDVSVTVLRTAPMLGVDGLAARLVGNPVCLGFMGQDPLVQLVHEADAVEAFVLALRGASPGVFNIVGPGVLPYRSVLAQLGRVPLPLPAPVLYPVWRALWTSRLTATEPELLDFLRYLCVADGAKARSLLGYRPRYDIHQIIEDFVGVGVHAVQEAAR